MMHGLMLRALQSYLTETFGKDKWVRISRQSGLGIASFEAMLSYPADCAEKIIAAASEELDRAPETLLEDLGTFVVSARNQEGLRRLLRFGGATFRDFLYTIDDLPDWAKLAVNGLELPDLQLHEISSDHFHIFVRGGPVGMCHTLVGLLRAMADDYGDLVFIELADQSPGLERISIRLAVQSFHEPRAFQLSTPEAAP